MAAVKLATVSQTRQRNKSWVDSLQNPERVYLSECSNDNTEEEKEAQTNSTCREEENYMEFYFANASEKEKDT